LDKNFFIPENADILKKVFGQDAHNIDLQAGNFPNISQSYQNK
jgi:hypothetical protein